MGWESLEDARREAVSCARCRLAGGRTQVVWMDGNPDSDLMFIGEAPGFHEDRLGRPFVGAAGKLLDDVLAEIGLDRDRCTICNVIKCRPPGNRNPLPDEIDACKPYLEAQIRFINPEVIVTLGNFATRFALQSQVSISRVRGQRFEAFGATLIPTFHPAAALHGGGKMSPAMASIREDLQLVASIIAERQAMKALAPATPDTLEQPTLF